MIRKRVRRRNKFLHKKNPQIYSRTEAIKNERKQGSGLKYIIFFLSAGFIYLFIFSPFLKIKEVLYSGDEGLKQGVLSKVEKERKGIFSGNIILLDTGSLSHTILEDTTIKELEIKKNFVKRTLSLEVKAQKPLAIYEERGKKFFLDDKGLIYKEVGEGEEGTQELININYKLADIHEPGSNVLNENVFIFTKEILKNFESKLTDKILLLEFENSVNELTVFSASNYKIYLDTKRDPNQQLDSALVVKKEAEKKRKTLDYIDLRVESRVFYKFR